MSKQSTEHTDKKYVWQMVADRAELVSRACTETDAERADELNEEISALDQKIVETPALDMKDVRAKLICYARMYFEGDDLPDHIAPDMKTQSDASTEIGHRFAISAIRDLERMAGDHREAEGGDAP